MRANVFSGGFLWQLIKSAGGEWMKDNAMRLSAALSYYSVFSIAPLLLIAIGIAGWFFEPEAASGKIEQQLTSIIGWEAAKAVQAVVKSASEKGGGMSLVGFAMLLIGASTVFGQLKESLNTIWEVAPKGGVGVWGFLRDRLLTFGMVLAIGFLLLVSLIAAAVVAGMGTWLEANMGLPKAVSGLFGFVIPLIMETALFAMLFKFLPDAEIPWRSVWVGAALTAVLFELGKLALSFYLTKAAPDSSFGAAGSVVVLLVWVYYASCILFFGAEVTEVYARMEGHAIQPAANAISTELKCEVAANTFGPAPVEPHPMTPPSALPPRSMPQHESLAPLIAKSFQPDPGAAQRAAREAELARQPFGQVRVWMERAHEHPVVELVAALGFGLVAGTLARMREKHELSPGEHFRLGAKEIGERGQTWAADWAGKLSKKLAKIEV